MKILYFTATGNCLYIAKRIGDEYYSIPKLIKEEKFEFEDAKIGIVVPTYALEIPKLVEDFLDRVKLKSDYIFAIATYGKYSGSVVNHLAEVGKRNGIEFSYINEILMVDNYLPVFDMKEEIQNESKKNIEGNLEKIIEDINCKKKFIRKNSAFQKRISKIAVKLLLPIQNKIIFKDVKVFDNNLYIENTCVGCGICAKVCPIDNIKLIDKKPVYQGNCMECLACINHCPQNAIRLMGEKSKARFINQNVTLKEIINSNN